MSNTRGGSLQGDSGNPIPYDSTSRGSAQSDSHAPNVEVATDIAGDYEESRRRAFATFGSKFDATRDDLYDAAGVTEKMGITGRYQAFRSSLRRARERGDAVQAMFDEQREANATRRIDTFGTVDSLDTLQHAGTVYNGVPYVSPEEALDIILETAPDERTRRVAKVAYTIGKWRRRIPFIIISFVLLLFAWMVLEPVASWMGGGCSVMYWTEYDEHQEEIYQYGCMVPGDPRLDDPKARATLHVLLQQRK